VLNHKFFFYHFFFLFPIRVPWAADSPRLWNGAGEDQAPHTDRLRGFSRRHGDVTCSRLEIDRSSCTGVLLSVTGCRVRWCGAHALPRYEILPGSGRLTLPAKNPNEAEHRQPSSARPRDSSMMRCGTLMRHDGRGSREGQETADQNNSDDLSHTLRKENPEPLHRAPRESIRSRCCSSLSSVQRHQNTVSTP
jgi:hypothetical protein